MRIASVEADGRRDRKVEEVQGRVTRALVGDAVDERLGLDETVPFDEQARAQVIGERVTAG